MTRFVSYCLRHVNKEVVSISRVSHGIGVNLRHVHCCPKRRARGGTSCTTDLSSDCSRQIILEIDEVCEGGAVAAGKGVVQIRGRVHVLHGVQIQLPALRVHRGRKTEGVLQVVGVVAPPRKRVG